MKTQKMILRDSDEAASIQTVTGWVSSSGRFWGNDEAMARYDGSTHQKCPKNPDHPVISNQSYCEVCHEEKQNEAYSKMERKPWNGEPLCVWYTDRYFFDAESIADYCEEHQVAVSDLKLVICLPNYPSEVDGSDIFCDDLPEDGELPSDLEDAFNALNKAIKNSPPLSWSPGNVAAIVTPEQLTA